MYVAERLFEIHEHEHWRALGFDSFSAYLRSLGLSRSHCIRLIRVYRRFCIEAGVDRTRLDAVGSAGSSTSSPVTTAARR